MTVTPKARHILIYGLLPAVILLAILTTTGVVYAQSYQGKILPGVFVGPVDVGGLTREEAAAKLAEATYEALKNGLQLTVDGNAQAIALLNEGVSDPDASYELVNWDIDAAVNEAAEAGRTRVPIASAIAPLTTKFAHRTIDFVPTINAGQLEAAVAEAFPEANHPAIDSGFAITYENEAWSVTTTPSSAGQVLNLSELYEAMGDSLERELYLPAVTLTLAKDEPEVSEDMAKKLVDRVLSVMNAAPYTLTYSDIHGEHTFVLGGEPLSHGLAVVASTGEFDLGFNEGFADTLRELTKEVLSPAQDAKLLIEDGEVKEFQASKVGVDVDVQATEASLMTIWGQAEASAELVTITIEPKVTTADVNDLGITEVIGVGTSNFSGSPTNRVKNIKNGAAILNGTLIKAGETFSLLNALEPFTTENGYFPELVIKGDKIQPEVGGGLCQIGTTTFRATMMSGLPVTERRNHSLVVRYYNDQRNNLPGTDATIYDPSPDFKFLNDTGHDILIATDVNTETGDLTFTFWGTSDGRKGSYSEPVVSSWIGAGATRNIETLDLAPGVRQCQHAYPGANASFTYTIEQPDGTKVEQVFTSSYRALPEICLVGVEKLTEETPAEGETPAEEAPADTDGSPLDQTADNGAPIE